MSDEKNNAPGRAKLRGYQEQAIRVWLASTSSESSTDSPIIKPELLRSFEDQLNRLSPEDRNAAVLEVQQRAVEQLIAFERNCAADMGLKGGGVEADNGVISAPQADKAHIPVTPVAPRAGETLIGLFCKRDMREAVLGDLDEKFAELAERRGAGAAKAWYWGQAGRSVLFFAVRWGRRLLELEAILKRIL